MASGKIRVTPEQISATAEKVNGKVTDYINLYKKLYTEVNNLGQNWEGEANKNFVNQIKGFEKEFENLKKVLESYVLFLREAAKIYSNTESNIKDATKKLTTGK